MTPPQDIREPLDRFLAVFRDELSVDDTTEFYCNHRDEEGDTFLRLETHVSPKLSRVVIEEYAIRGKMRGTVIMALPRPEIDVPIFFFQLGGIGDRSIAVLDISPTARDIDYTPLIPVYEKYRDQLGLEPTKAAWLQTICSPYLLHCNYAELDTGLFMDAMDAYVQVWLEHYYRPASAIAGDSRAPVISNAIYKFKYQLHHHDPAYGIFARAWGKPAADAFVELECGDDPAYLAPEQLESKVKPWQNRELNVLWAEDAQLLAEASSDPTALRDVVEPAVAGAGLGIVTPEVLEQYGSPA